MGKDWVDFEFRNWARWANSGPMPGPSLGVDPMVLYDEDSTPPPIHVDNAKIVQRIFDSSILIERKVLQAEYLSPWKYARHTDGIPAAARRLEISAAAYEMHLICLKRRVERAFR